MGSRHLVPDADDRGANMLEQFGPEISAPVWTGKKLAGLAGDPIGHEPHPFARSRIDKAQPFGKTVGKLQQIAALPVRQSTGYGSTSNPTLRKMPTDLVI